MGCKCAIFCDIARWQILHAVKEIRNTKNTLTLVFMLKNIRRSTMRHFLQQKAFVARHMAIVARQIHYVQWRKNSSIPQNIGFVQYFVVLMQ